ncbi:carbohydrate ABC transporter permease [Cohnella sp. LGH]|uniref:carbohydrate ABC transporter permease n=1 Tax=Cohnella sp. LGH TaxID=1619153 RepID=UPI001ADAE8EB|nr:carbohydrate ABC transporter permease [Cohnella sp. LGH]QTH43944.1 carbohydrate ABC transporter permease [Cohnella sp. LGH]
MTYAMRRAAGLSRGLVLAVFALSTLFPFYWVLVSSLKDKHQIYANPFGLPANWHWGNYADIWQTAHLSRYFWNSLFISACAVAIMLLIGAMAAYVLARREKSGWLYAYFTLGIMIPVHAILIPSFLLLKQLHLLNSHFGLILIYVVSNLSLCVFILHGFLRGIPRELEEAAAIDGYGRVRTFVSIVLPLAKPGLATVGTLGFLNCWNEYLFAYVLIGSEPSKTLTQGVMALTGQYSTDYALVCAGLVVSMLPLWLVYMLFQEQIVKGMTAGAVKG